MNGNGNIRFILQSIFELALMIGFIGVIVCYMAIIESIIH